MSKIEYRKSWKLQFKTVMKQAKVLLSLDMIKKLTQIVTSFKLEKEKSWLQFGQNVKEAYQKSKTVVNPYRILKFTWIISIVYVLWFMSALSNLMKQREVFVFLSFFFFFWYYYYTWTFLCGEQSKILLFWKSWYMYSNKPIEIDCVNLRTWKKITSKLLNR